jgi:hypothetical protein
LKVEPQSGFLRLALWLILLFIFWSLLAYISSTANPLPTFPSLWPSSTNGATSLGSDLWQEMLGNYFSAFTLLNLALVLLISWTVFLIASFMLSRALGLAEVKAAQHYLRSCLFSLQDYPLISTLDPNYQKSDAWKILTGIGGPCYLLLEPDNAILINRINGYTQLVSPSADADNIVFFRHGEKAITILPAGPFAFTLHLDGMDKAGRPVNWRSLRLACNPLFPTDNAASGENSSDYGLIASVGHENQNWKDRFEEILDLEIQSFLQNFSIADLRQAFKMEKPTSAQANLSKPSIRRIHQTAHHRRLYPIPGNFFQWKNQGGFLRRRRRLLLPELGSSPVSEKKPEPSAKDFESELVDYLSLIFKNIYNISVKVNIENIGEIQFNGEN